MKMCLFSEVRTTSPWCVLQPFAPKAEGQKEPDSPGERETKFMRDSRAGGGSTPKDKVHSPMALKRKEQLQ